MFNKNKGKSSPKKYSNQMKDSSFNKNCYRNIFSSSTQVTNNSTSTTVNESKKIEHKNKNYVNIQRRSSVNTERKSSFSTQQSEYKSIPRNKIIARGLSLRDSPQITKQYNNSDSSFNPKKLQKLSYPIPSICAAPNQKKNPGMFYIFHNDKFMNPKIPYRKGSKKDVSLLVTTFKKFNVNSEIYENYTIAKIDTAMEKLSLENFNRNSCIIFAVLSHGERNNILHAYDGKYSFYDKIIYRIIRNKSLNGKPKIFIVQSCKGSNDPRFSSTDSPGGTANDIVIFFSCFEGYISLRDDNIGTIFINEFCAAFNKLGKDKDIKEIMEETIKQVKINSSSCQIPTIKYNMTNRYVFGEHC